MTNSLIESTIRFAENTSRINGNLRSGVIKESRSFPDEHVKQGLERYARHTNDGAFTVEEAKGMLNHYAKSELGYSKPLARDFVKHIVNTHNRSAGINEEESGEKMTDSHARDAAQQVARLGKNLKVTSFNGEHFVHHKEDPEGENGYISFAAKGGHIHAETASGAVGRVTKHKTVADAVNSAKDSL